MCMQANSTKERGVALLIAIFALVIVTAVAMAMMFLAETETTNNANYRDDQASYYAARAGLEEARDRMRANAGTGISINANLPTALPGTAGGALYIINPANGETVAPWSTSNEYFDDEICKELGCTQVPSASGWYVNPPLNASSTYAATPTLPYKWIRITLKVNRSAYGSANVMYVNGNSSSTSANYQVCWNGANEYVSSIGCPAANAVYVLTALSVTSKGSRRMAQYEVVPAVPVSVDAAIHTILLDVMGDALNVTGFTDPVCSLPATYGVQSGATITTPGGGNVTGSPAGINPYAPFPYNMNAIISALTPQSSPIDSLGTGVTGSGTPTSYSGPHAVLGVAPTVTYDSSAAITAITSPGTPAIYYSPGNLTLGTSVIGGAPVSGQGVLVVQGNLTMDVTNGFNYFGLILVAGDITMTANPETPVNSNIHGAIIGSGKFGAAALTDLSGSIFIHQNACLVQNQFNTLPLKVVAFREIPL
jgi:hypothetical protein